MTRIAAFIAAAAWLVPGALLAADPVPAAPAAAQPAPPPAPPKTSSARAVDRLQLESTTITGSRELPKVMSIVPWKPAEPSGGLDRPMGSLVDGVLSPLDRDEFRREITYYRDLTSHSSTVVAPGATKP